MRSKTGKHAPVRRLSARDDLYDLFGVEQRDGPDGPMPAAEEEPFDSLLDNALSGMDQGEIIRRKYPEPGVPDRKKQRMSPAAAPRAELDLHGCHVQEALVRVEAFIATSALQGFSAVRIIVGRGLHSQAGAVLPDAVEKKIVELKRAGRVATFAWEKKYKRVSGSMVVFLPYQAVEKPPSAALRSSFVTAAYGKVRLIPHDFARLASERFEQPV